MDTRSRNDDNKTDENVMPVIKDEKETEKAMTKEEREKEQKKEKETPLQGAGRQSYDKNTAGVSSIKAPRVVLFVISIFLLSYLCLAVHIVNDSEVVWNIETLLSENEQDELEENTQALMKTKTEHFYDALCLVGSGYLRYDSSYLSGEYMQNLADVINSLIAGGGKGGAVVDKGFGYTLETMSDDFDYYVAYGNRIMTNIDTLRFYTTGATFEELEGIFKNGGQRFFILMDGAVFSGNGKGGNAVLYDTDGTKYYTTPQLRAGRTYYDSESKMHIFYFVNQYDVSEYSDNGYSNITYYPDGLVEKYDEESGGYEQRKIMPLDGSGLVVALSPKESAVAAARSSAAVQTDDTRLFIITGIIAAAALFVVVLVLLIYSGYDKTLKRFFADTVLERVVPVELMVAAALGSLVGASVNFYEFSGGVKAPGDPDALGQYAVILGIYGFLWLTGFGSILLMVRKLKAREFFRDSLIIKCAKVVFSKAGKLFADAKRRYFSTLADKLSVAKRMVIRNVIFAGVSIIYVVLLAVNSTSDYIDDRDDYYFFITFLYMIYFAFFTFNNAKYYTDASRLCDKIYSVSENEEYKGEEVADTSVFYPAYKRVGDIDEIAKKNAGEMIKSERTKVELVTNVSHDLKTPLTSIISYVYLLGDEEMSDTARDYVKVLQQKSEKLKSIVNDVFTLAKAAGGAEIKRERLDLTMLLNQTIASSQDLIEKSGRAVKCSIPEKPAVIIGDGDKLSRVLQNLLDNALKYSLEGTRVYVDMTNDDLHARIVFANVSREEMNFTAEEITERFARGDKSRTDGGSGLGLSIAKTFTEACGGEFRVELDGDVFKAITVFEITKE